MQVEADRTHAPLHSDLLIWSSTWLALGTASVTAAAALAMETPPDPILVALAFCGTIVVYVIDHMRDADRDQDSSPLRAAYMGRYRTGLSLFAGLSAIASLVLGVLAGPEVVLLAAAVLTLGLLHRRLKNRAWTKPAYVALAWVTVTVGFTAVSTPGALHVGRVATLLAATGAANVVLYNLRGSGAAARPLARLRGRPLSALLLALAAGLALTGPDPVQRLVWVPACMAAAMCWPRFSERARAWITDGALLAGGLLALLLP